MTVPWAADIVSLVPALNKPRELASGLSEPGSRREAGSKPIRIGLLGCGTVGGGVIQLLNANAEYLAQSVGAPLEVARVLVRAPDKERVPELDRGLLTTDPEAVFGEGDIDVFVEVMGGVAPARG